MVAFAGGGKPSRSLERLPCATLQYFFGE